MSAATECGEALKRLPGASISRSMGLPGVSTILWRQRRLLEQLAFKLDAQQLLLANGRDRWLSQTTDEIDAVLEELRNVEVLRAAQVDAAANRLGVGPNPSLAELATAAPRPYDEILRHHRDALLALLEVVQDRRLVNLDVIERSQQDVRALLVGAGTERSA
jgi:hypothetical protein